MNERLPQKSGWRKWGPWLPVFLCFCAILATVPLARTMQKFIYRTAGQELFTYIVVLTVVIGAVILLCLLAFRLKVRSPAQYIWILLCAALYLYYTAHLKQHPEEAIHFLEYGLLSFFIFRALSRSVEDTTVYFSSFLLVSIAGTADEFFQWLIPQRYWSFADIRLNIFGGGIFLLAIWKGVRPRSISNRIRARSVRTLTILLTLNMLAIGLCLSNTPDAVRRYTGALDILSWLKSEEAMTEFGFLHTDADIGAVYSRFSAEELKETDRKQGIHYGEILKNRLKNGASLDGLMAVFNQNTDPFLYEFLIHLYRRNEHQFDAGSAARGGISAESAFTALKENTILERFFGTTLRHTGFELSPEITGPLRERSAFWSKNYRSTAGGKIITAFTLKQAWLVIAAIMAIAWALSLTWQRRLKRQDT